MTITQHISIDLQQPGNAPMIHAVQGDEYSRKIEIELYSNGVSWNPPDDCEVTIRYGKPDGKGGIYAVLPDNTVAYSIAGNAITVTLAPQMVTVPGLVEVQVSIIKDRKDRISTFSFAVDVEADPSKGELKSENYVNWKSYYIPQTTGATVGQYLEIEEVDTDGRVIAVKAVDAPSGEEISSAVDAYLDKHPEITTTLQDGEITAEKLHQSLKWATVNDFVVPQMFGAIGDGVHDDTEAFKKLNGKRAYIPRGVYRVSNVEYGPDTIIMGSGMGSTVIQQIGTEGDMIAFKDATRAGMSNITLTGSQWDVHTACTDPYAALLKIYTTTEHENFSQHCVYEHIQIYKTINSGFVLLGKDTASGTPNTNWNWVHHFNDFRVEYCNAWCMIDETTDNKFYNFYLSEGGLGGMLLDNAWSNQYSNFKLDQPMGNGAVGDPDGWDSGALLVCKNSGGLRMTNFDIQSSHYHGMKVSSTSVLHFDGQFSLIGYSRPDCLPVALKMTNTNNVDASAIFYEHASTSSYVNIDRTCSYVIVNMREVGHKPSYNNSGTSLILEASTMVGLYKTQVSDRKFNNLLTNSLPTTMDGWGFEGDVTLDESGMILDGSSFKLENKGADLTGIYQTISGIKAGHKYLFVAACYAETLASTFETGYRTPYILAVQDDNALENEDGLVSIGLTTGIGHSVMMYSTTAKSNGDITFCVYNYRNNGVYYIGNMYAIDLSDNPMFRDTPGYIKEIADQFDTSVRVSTIHEKLGPEHFGEVLAYLLEKGCK